VLDQASQKPLGFVSIGVLGHPYGTVADARGHFTLDLPTSYDTDSVRFSLIGYASRTWQIAKLRQLTRTGPLLLQARPVPLADARVASAGLKRRFLGNPTLRSTFRIEDFAANLAGNQLGQRLTIQKPSFLEEVSVSITDCSYDTVYYRLNVYNVRRDYPAENLLPVPVYFKVSQAQSKSRIHLNLRRYNLLLHTDAIVSVELIRSLGKGTLALGCKLAGGGPMYKLEQTPGPGTALNKPPRNSVTTVDLKRKQPDGPWVKYPTIGLGIDATVLEIPN
jgi:hypothetical protein